MPALGRGVQEADRRHRGRADPAGFDRGLQRLGAGAEEGVRRAPDEHARGARRVEQLPGVGDARGQRLLRVEVAARRDRLAADRRVVVGRRQAQDDLDVLTCEQLVDAARGEPVLAGNPLGPLRVEVRARHQPDAVEPRGVVEIDAADGAAADQPDADVGHSTGISGRERPQAAQQ